MSALLVKLIEVALPPLIQAVVTHYERKEELKEVEQTKLDAHRDALDALKK